MIAQLAALPDLIWLAPALPLVAALSIGLRVLLGRAHGDAAEPLTARLAGLTTLAGLLLLVGIDSSVAVHGWPGLRHFGRWFGAGPWQGELSFLIDGLSLSLATMSALIGWLVVRFSANYLHREAGFHRFFFVLCLFLSGMQLLLLAGNALLTFVGWEMCGVSSFLLIGYVWQRPVATGNALFAFVVNRAGDAGILFGLGMSAVWLNSFEWPALLANPLPAGVDARLLVLGFVLAALAKSAQLPFTPWITKALEGPTPSSAIFYGALMVHAGVYLMLRLQPLLDQAPEAMVALVVIGSLTALYAWLCGLVQSDVKSALIHATVFQVALMFVEIGLGWSTVANIHLCLHAGWRAWQFLLAPSWLAVTRQPPAPPPAWLARQQWLYTAAQQGFWLDRLALVLLVRPTEAFARDLRGLEEKVIDRLIGEAGRAQPVQPDRLLVGADGLPGRALAVLGEILQRIENRLLLRGRGGTAERMLKAAGAALRTLEGLLEQPRYLMMAVMLTFVVIL